MGSVAHQSTPFHVLVIGGSYGGLSACLNLLDLCSGRDARCNRGEAALSGSREPIEVELTIVDERDGFLHLIGCPLALASDEYASKAWVRYDSIPALQRPNVRVVQGTARKVDPRSKTAVIKAANVSTEEMEIKYDFLVGATGLRRVWPVVPQSLDRKAYLLETAAHVRAVSEAEHGVLVVGGGAVGIEMAAELKMVRPGLRVTLAHSREKLLSSEGLPDECKDVALRCLREQGVEVLMGHRLEGQREVDVTGGDESTGTATKAVEATFTNGHKLVVDTVIMALSNSVPSTTYLPSDVLDEEGYLKIQPNLAFPSDSPNATSHFGTGDLVRWSGIKRCGGAMHHGYYVATNIHQVMLQQLHGQKPSFNELGFVPPMIGLAVGKTAVSYGPEDGTKHGEDVMERFFGDDLGFTICWNYLRLREGKASSV